MFKFPSIDDPKRLVSRLTHSALGSQCIPHAAWKSMWNTRTRYLVASVAVEGIWWCPPVDIVSPLMVFLIPKDDGIGERCDITRTAADTRPLGLKSTDVQILSASISTAMMPHSDLCTLRSVASLSIRPSFFLFFPSRPCFIRSGPRHHATKGTPIRTSHATDMFGTMAMRAAWRFRETWESWWSVSKRLLMTLFHWTDLL